MEQKNCTDITNLPYERFLKFGPTHLTNAELLGIILRTGTKQKSAVALANEILALQKNQSGKLIGLHHVTVDELMQIPGIGQVKAVKIKALAELSIRMSKESTNGEVLFTKPQTIVDYYMESFRHHEIEQVLLVMLDNKGHLLSDQVISKGTVNASLVSSREVFRQALRHGASGIILLHNHPSGDPTPSVQDKQITKTIFEGGKLMNIPLIDHIIVGDRTYTSFKELGLF
ncbi:MAG: DNA repair protein RadC [Lachnospiraceae bacterium]